MEKIQNFSVLMYHEIIKKEDFNYTCYKGIKVQSGDKDRLPPVLFAYLESFNEQMKYLYEEGYVTLTLQDLIDFYYKGKALPEKAVLLTFDDLYQSVLTYAYPILKQYHFHAVGFVVEDWLFEEQQNYVSDESICLSKKELEQMKDVFEYANHTKALHGRKDGQTALQRADKTMFLEDLNRCEQFVDTQKVFAYPFGVYTQEHMDWLKEAGFLLAFTTEGGFNNQSTNPYKLHRNGVLLDYDFAKFTALIKD
ncbi:MAG: hypothetical protein K0R69_820 [Clostridia bacterium]|jgi:peptidoglycan/xylan/chitin deacetylase (PgdA/CDA1 family)|nr:hypothetical protein [Clostridia bacterium]